MMGFEWINDLALWFAGFIPRWGICEPTQGGVKFTAKLPWEAYSSLKIKIIPIEPGLYFWWPVISRVHTIPVVRQSVDLPTQSIETKDGYSVMLSTVLVYEIDNAAVALTEAFDIDETIQEIGAAAAMDVMRDLTYEEARNDLASGVLSDRLTESAQELLEDYGVTVISGHFTDFVKHTAIRCEGGQAQTIPTEEDE